MKSSTLLTLGLLAASSMIASTPANAAVVVGGPNGWEFSTDGIVDLFSYYTSTGKGPGAGHSLSLLSIGGNESESDQRFGTGIGLLPSVVAFNVKAPTTNGVDSSVRVGIYPALQNSANGNRFNTNPNIDFREFFYTAKGSAGELLVGRALNLYQGKNILNDMTLLSAGVVPGAAFQGNTTLGHIGYGYLYTNFGPQFRYTTPDMGGTKVAVSIGEPYKVSGDTTKRSSPRLETEVSYANKFGDTAVQVWLSGLYQSGERSNGDKIKSTGAAYGASATMKNGLGLMGSGYYGKGLGMVSVQDGDFLGSTSIDGAGKERTHWGFLAQATYALTPAVTVGVNYGQSRQNESDYDKIAVDLASTGPTDTINGISQIKTQGAATVSVTYAFNNFTKFTAEYTNAKNTWMDGATQKSNQFALGSTFFW
ncbi:MAG: hypothetical protein PHY09_01455 [Desulfuromonadaceae bacterium]|nr:hypothetical protein [Desulfuromonadaceae bacterium]MDD5104983.1 hypothetical protein [Desulfuromonadaceae bacterium]